MAAALSSLGDGNWRMGEGMSKTGQRTNAAEDDDSGILENYIRKGLLFSSNLPG
jgi:exocyst complex protein 7